MNVFQLITYTNELGTPLAAMGLGLAYIGPGGGLSALGALLAIVAGFAVAIFGFVWYPLKRILGTRTKHDGDSEGSSP